MTQLDNDYYDREVWYETDGLTTDTYQVKDTNDSDYIFTLTFPIETATWYAYTIINEIPLRGVPNLSPFSVTNLAAPWLSGRTADRINIEPVLGMMYFDLDLGKPIFFIGSGSTGWVDASGAQV